MFIIYRPDTDEIGCHTTTDETGRVPTLYETRAHAERAIREYQHDREDAVMGPDYLSVRPVSMHTMNQPQTTTQSIDELLDLSEAQLNTLRVGAIADIREASADAAEARQDGNESDALTYEGLVRWYDSVHKLYTSALAARGWA